MINGTAGRKALIAFLSLTLAGACAPSPTPTLFRPPANHLSTAVLPTTTPVPQIYSPAPATPTIPAPTETISCFNDLKFVSDATVPDGTVVLPNSIIDKQWIVLNAGTCNWDSRYRLRLIGGDAMGAAIEQALFPARAGTQATLRIVFTAPSGTGYYESRWQAYDPNGIAFGSDFYMKIAVSP